MATSNAFKEVGSVLGVEVDAPLQVRGALLWGRGSPGKDTGLRCPSGSKIIILTSLRVLLQKSSKCLEPED